MYRNPQDTPTTRETVSVSNTPRSGDLSKQPNGASQGTIKNKERKEIVDIRV